MEDVVTDCAKCGDAEEHEVLKASEHNLTLKCLECGTVRSMSPPSSRTRQVTLVWSHGDRSQRDAIETFVEDTISKGDEFEHLGHRMLVTALEGEDHRRHASLPATDVHTVYAKVFDTVPLRVSVNQGDITKSYQEHVDPEMAVSIGQVVRAQDQLFVVKTLKSDQNRTLHKGFLLARNIRRAFCDPAPSRAKEGQIITTRRRGLPPGKKSLKPGSRVKGPRGR